MTDGGAPQGRIRSVQSPVGILIVMVMFPAGPLPNWPDKQQYNIYIKPGNQGLCSVASSVSGRESQTLRFGIAVPTGTQLDISILLLSQQQANFWFS